MAKTYTAAGSATAGDVYTAAAHNVIVTDVNNFIVPAACEVYRTSNLTSYTSNTEITWQAENFDTDNMWTSGASLTITTPGIYMVGFSGLLTATATLSLVVPGIFKNGNRIRIAYMPFTSTASYFMLAAPIIFANNDTLSASVELVGGSAYNVNGGTVDGLTTTKLSAVWMGRTS